MTGRRGTRKGWIAACSVVEGTTRARAALIASLAILSCGAVAMGCKNQAKIAASSRNEACKGELVGALKEFAKQQGFAYTVQPQDADSIFASGTVTKTYARDGVEHGCVFGVEITSQGCTLQFQQRTTSEPGRFTSKSGGSAMLLRQCRCEP